MAKEARTLYEALRSLEHRAKSARRSAGDVFSRRETARVVRSRYGVALDSRRISTWLPNDPAKAQVPRADSDAMWAMVRLWSAWAGEKPSERYWRDLIEAAQPERGTRGAADGSPGTPIGEVSDPFAFEVHRAIGPEASDMQSELPLLPTYIEREHDLRLRELVEQAASGRSAFGVLVGGSSTGKTRACWEAVHRLPPDWTLWHPIDPGRPEAAAQTLDTIKPHTVVWLNETQHYLLTPSTSLGERVAGGLRELLRTPERGPVLVLGTLWPEYWEVLTTTPSPGADDPHAQARALLTSHGIPVPDAFTSASMEALRAVAATDPRLAQARDHAEDRLITQYLAGAPALLERYLLAPTGARTVLHAAMDARRLEHGPLLSHALLEAAAPGYLTDAQWSVLGEDWLEQALAYSTVPCQGARALLRRVRSRPGEPGLEQPYYRLADYLEQHARTERLGLCPPAAFWDAAVLHARTTEDRKQLGYAAEAHGRLCHAAQLYQAAADRGDRMALMELARLRRNAGDEAGAEQFALVSGTTWAVHELAEARAEEEDWAGAEALYSLAQDDAWALLGIAELRERQGDLEGAEAFYREVVDRGEHGRALAALARLRERAGDQDEAEELAVRAVDAGSSFALLDLGDLRAEAGDQEGAEALYLSVGDEGEVKGLRRYAVRRAAVLRERVGDTAGAKEIYQRLADTGLSWAVREIGQLHEQAGDVDGAEALYRRAVDDGDTWMLTDLGRLREQAGDLDEAEALYGKAAIDDSDALTRLVLLWARTGRRDRAEETALRAASGFLMPATNGWATEPLRELARLLVQAADVDGAKVLYRRAADVGCDEALEGLVELLEQTGEPEEADRLRRFGFDAHGIIAAPWQSAPRPPTVAHALSKLAMRLLRAGWPYEALHYSERAVDMWRNLAATDPAAHELHLARALSEMGLCLAAVRSREEALEAIKQSVQVYRRFATIDQMGSPQGFVTALLTLRVYLPHLEWREEAAAPTAQSVPIHKGAGAATPQEQEFLAFALRHLGAQLAWLGHYPEAAEAAARAVEIYRTLALTDPAVHEPDLAHALGNLGSFQAQAGQQAEALCTSEQAVIILRRLTASDAATHEPHFAWCLRSFAHVRTTAGVELEQAAEAAAEALTISNRLAERDPGSFEELQAMAWIVRLISLHKLGRYAEANKFLGRHTAAPPSAIGPGNLDLGEEDLRRPWWARWRRQP
ncbi:hypothetical protein ACF1B0_30835 [Streptomyces anandii]|uniref:tetratricopeptide repeat protein n=1 Tax=Streptomyces anandii TaxID=285454 RepID=UPI0036F5BD27